MKLFLISNMYPDTNSPGYGVFVKNVADYLNRNNFNISYTAVIQGRSRNLIHKIVKYIIFYFKIISHYFKTYDAVYIHYPNMAVPILLPLFWICKKKMIVNYHGEDLLYSGRIGVLLGRYTEKFVRDYANVVIVPSTFFKQELLKRKICKEDKIVVFPSGGIDPEIFYPSSKKRTKCLNLGYVGRIEYGKGWKEYILSLSKLNEFVDFRGFIIGYGALEPEMHELISQCNLNDKIELIKGVSQKELRHFYTQFDLLLFTTQLPESLGLVGLESMACGTPIVATNIGGVATYTINDFNGFLVDKGDIMGIVHSVEKYINMDETQKTRMINNCIATAKKYSTETIYVSFLRDIKRFFYL